jgi:hypothetical protein
MRLNVFILIAWFFSAQIAVAGVLDALKSDPPKEQQSDVQKLTAKNAAAEKAAKKKAKKPVAGTTKMTRPYGAKAGGGVALGIVDQKGTVLDGSLGLYKRLSSAVNLGFDVSLVQGLTEGPAGGCTYNRRINAFGAGPSYHTQISGHAWFDAGLNAGYAMFWASGECDTAEPMVFATSRLEAASIYIEPVAGASYWFGRLAIGPEFRKPIFFGPHQLVKDARQLGEFFLNAKYTF